MQGEHGIPFDTLTNQAVIMRALLAMIEAGGWVTDRQLIAMLRQRIDYSERLCGSERIPGQWQPPEKS